jgi:CheY-like chemotaxis protein
MRTILVADDESAILGLAALSLDALGHRSVTASDGQQALDRFLEHNSEIDAVMLDLTMPRMNGEEAARHIRAICPGVPIVLVSGYGREDVEARVDNSLFSGFLQKPFMLDTLAAAIDRALASATPRG